MALKGNLHDFSLTQLLNLIHLARKTGTLAIDGKHSAARAAFREGKLVFAQTDTLDGRLVGGVVLITFSPAWSAAPPVERGTSAKADRLYREAIDKYLSLTGLIDEAKAKMPPNCIARPLIWENRRR